MYYDLTRGSIPKSLFFFALPMMAGNLLQQFYNIADTLIVGRVLGKNALAAVGSVYTLMTFLTSVFLGLSMGAGALFSIYLGKKKMENLRSAVYRDDPSQWSCLSFSESDSGISPGSCRGLESHEGLSADHFWRPDCHISL